MGSLFQKPSKGVVVGTSATIFLLLLVFIFHREILFFLQHYVSFDLSGHPGNGGY